MSNTPSDGDPRAGHSRQLVEHFFRHEAGRLIALLTRRFGPARLELIEDAVQTALEQALGSWTRRGAPEHPEAWLTRVAQNRVVDLLRSRRREVPDTGVEAGSAVFDESQVALGSQISDDRLRMLFLCCDDELQPQARLVLCLKLVCGFSTHEIAARLFLKPPNVQKLLERGRLRLREAWGEALGDLDVPRSQVYARLESVRQVIYLQFNEGYSSQRAEEPVREDLCWEALRLGQLLVSEPVGFESADSWALLALFHFHLARLQARQDGRGGLLLLEEQDRTTWDAEEIQAGLFCLARSAEGDMFTRYHGEAAILAEHCLAPSYEATRWDEVVCWYELLEALSPSPLYTLNRAIALAETSGPESARAVLKEMVPPTWLEGYYLWDATLGELARRAGDFDEATRRLSRAQERAPTQAERQVFERKLGAARAGRRTRNG